MLAEVDLTEPLANALWQLGPDERPLSRRQLAQRLDCDPSNVTFLVDRLEEKGLVKRAVGQHDRRVKAVSLTPAGATVRKRLVAASAAAPVFAVLTKTQKQQLTALLGVCLEGTRP
jgi:DNA-binding MarR family transcriptional regulator